MSTAVHKPTKFRQIPVEKSSEGRGTLPDRLLSLDAFRGFIMTALAAHGFGVATFADHPQLGWLGAQFRHVPWEGIVFWDLIQPAFMFMVGLAMPFAFRVREKGQRALWRHVAYRAIVLILISQVLISVGRAEAEFQLINVLSQIGLTYFICYSIMQLPLKTQFVVGGLILAGHTALFHAFAGAGGAWSQTANIGERIDHFFGLNYSGYYVTINFISSTVTTMAGVWCGYLMLQKVSHERRMKVMGMAIAGCFAAGFLLSLFNPVVKRLWTASFTLLSTGLVIALLLAFYWMVEVKGLRKATFPLVVVGMNSIFIYCMQMLLWGWIRDALGVFTGDFAFLGAAGPVAQAASVFAVLWYLCWWLYQRKAFIRI